MKQDDIARMITELGQDISRRLAKAIWIQPVPVMPIDSITLNFIVTPQSKYKFSRARWYQANFDTAKYDEVRAWCTEQFGPEPRNHDAWSRWHHKFEDSIMFRDQEDYVLFVLRWGAC